MRLLTRDETDMLFDALDNLQSMVAENEITLDLEIIYKLRSLVIDAAAQSQDIYEFLRKTERR